MEREIASLYFFYAHPALSTKVLLLSTKVLRLKSEPSLPEQIEFRPDKTKLASCPSDPLTPFLLRAGVGQEGRSR